MTVSALPGVLSLGDRIDPVPNFEKFCIHIVCNQIFDPNSWNPNQSLRRNRLYCVWFIPKDQKEIENDRKRSNLKEKCNINLLFQLNLTFFIV